MLWKAAVSPALQRARDRYNRFFIVAVAGSAVKWLRDSMQIIGSAAEVNDLAAKEDTTGGVYFVTAFSGLLAPYWDPDASGILIGLDAFFFTVPRFKTDTWHFQASLTIPTVRTLPVQLSRRMPSRLMPSLRA